MPQKLKIELPYDPAIPLLGIHLKKTKILIQKDKCTPMFTKMNTIVKSLCIIPALTLYFRLLNTHTKNLTENPKHFVFSLFHLLLFSCLSKCLWLLCILHYNGSPQIVPFTAQTVPQLTGYHFTILVKILIVRKMSCCFRAYPYSEQEKKKKKNQPLSALLPHTRAKNPAAQSRLVPGQRMLEPEWGRQGFGTGGASIMWMI